MSGEQYVEGALLLEGESDPVERMSVKWTVLNRPVPYPQCLLWLEKYHSLFTGARAVLVDVTMSPFLGQIEVEVRAGADRVWRTKDGRPIYDRAFLASLGL